MWKYIFLNQIKYKSTLNELMLKIQDYKNFKKSNRRNHGLSKFKRGRMNVTYLAAGKPESHSFIVTGICSLSGRVDAAEAYLIMIHPQLTLFTR